MKIALLAPALIALAVLSACDSSTSSSSPSLPGSPDPALAGTWRSAKYSAGSYADTMLVVLSESGAFSSTTHDIGYFNGAIEFDSKCAVSGSWTVSGGSLYSSVSGSCSETGSGATTTDPVPQSLDTASYSLQGSTLKLIHTSSDGNDTTVLIKI